MKSVLFTTAEYASVSNDGKLSIAGIFDSIQSGAFPATAPRMVLVAQLKAEPGESGKVFDMRFQLVNESDEVEIDLSTAGEVPHSDLGLGVLMNQVVTLNNVSFDTPGQYHFRVLVNGDVAATLPFAVVEVKKPSNKV